MPTKTALEISCKPPGTIVTIDGKQWCVGEKIISKNPRSRWNKKKQSKRKKSQNKTKKRLNKKRLNK
jgi:hypothetical protein